MCQWLLILLGISFLDYPQIESWYDVNYNSPTVCSGQLISQRHCLVRFWNFRISKFLSRTAYQSYLHALCKKCCCVVSFQWRHQDYCYNEIKCTYLGRKSCTVDKGNRMCDFLLFSANFALLQKCAILLHLQRRQQLLWIFSTSLHVGTQLQFHVVCQKNVDLTVKCEPRLR